MNAIWVALLSGGIISSLIETVRQSVRARQRRRELAEREPEVRVDSSLERAQKALLIMESALNATAARADAAERTVRELRAEIDHLEAELDGMRERLTTALDALSQRIETAELA